MRVLLEFLEEFLLALALTDDAKRLPTKAEKKFR
jgi:hypothetical protein